MQDNSFFTRVPLDPITLRVLGGAFVAIAKEIASTVIRTAYSQIVHENEDIGAGIFDPEGNQICESDSTPMHVGSIPGYIQGVLTRLRGNLEDGDIILHNHPYYGASHTPDVLIATPIFWEGKLVGFSAVNAHLIDVGEAYPIYCIDVPDVWGEARLYYALKIYERGVRNEQLWLHILDNVRAPSLNEGDMLSMVAAVKRGKKRFLELIERYGPDTVMSAAYDWMDYSEKMLRREVEKIPDGSYYAEGWVDDDARNRGVPIKVAVTIQIAGSDITVDFTGSSPEVLTAFNVPFDGSTKVCAYFIIRTIFLDEAAYDEFVPQNQGFFRPITVTAPKGSIFNPRFPRACHTRFAQCMRAVDLIIKAFAHVVPQKINAGCSSIGISGFSGFVQEKQEYWACLLINPGCHGGRYGKDGMDSVCTLFANIRNMPIEELEMRYPIRCERYELRDAPPAAGQWRGGIGLVVQHRFLTDGFICNLSDRQYEGDPPWGFEGGHDGLPHQTILNPGTDREQPIPSKVQALEARAGDAILNIGAMAGGYGDPLMRDPQQVLEDMLDEYITSDVAEREYGVVIRPNPWRVDEEATRALRDRR